VARQISDAARFPNAARFHVFAEELLVAGRGGAHK
jgi:hypothetical protein